MAETSYKIICLVISLILGDVAYCHAQSESSDTLSANIEEVVVYSNTYKEVIPSQKMEGEILHKLNSHSVADAIRYFSGAQLKDYGGIGGLKTVNIRSMGSNHVGVFYDGIQLGNAQNGQIDLGKYSLDNMEMITLYNGNKSDILQSAKDYGNSGALYLKTRRPKFIGNKRYNILGTFKTGSFGLINPSFLVEYKISDAVNLSVNTEYTGATGRYKFRYKAIYSDGTLAYDTTAVRKNGDINAIRSEIGLFGNTLHGIWNVKGYFYYSDRGIPGAVVNNVFARGERQWDRNAFVQGSFQNMFTSKYQMLVSAKYSNDYLHFLRDDDKELYVNNNYTQQEFYISMANLYKIMPWWQVSLSTDFQWNTLNANLTNFSYPRRCTELIALASALQIERFKAQASVLSTVTQETIKENSASQPAENRCIFTPALFANYQILQSQSLFVRAFYKRIFRLPTFNELYYVSVGSSTLKPEYTNQFDVGFSYEKQFEHSLIRNFQVQIDGYYNYVENKIICTPTTSQVRWTTINLGLVKILGLDFSANTTMSIDKVLLMGKVAYTYQSARDFTDPADYYYGNQIPYVPHHSGSAIVQASWRKWDFNYSFIYTGARTNAQEDDIRNHEEPWYTSDLSLSRELEFSKVNLRITAEVNNVFNQHYDVVANYPMPGTNFKFIFRINI